MARIFINSIPKSGTYRVAALLQHAGIESTGLHITEDKAWDYGAGDIQIGRSDPESAFLEGVTPTQALDRVADTQLLVGHFGFSIQHARLLQPFTTIFLIRDIREVIVSWCRWQVFSGQNPRLAVIDDPRQMIVSFLEVSVQPTAQIILSLLPWYHYLPSEHIFRVNDLGDTQTLIRLFRVCGCDISNTAADEIMKSVEGQETLTKVPGATLLSDYWSSEAEVLFQSRHLDQVNHILGFERVHPHV